MAQLNGKHALITGGGTGIGLAIAKAFAAEGAQVTICGRRAAVVEEVAASTPGLHGLACDVTDETSVQTAFAAATEARGAPDIVVANAGIAETKPLLGMELDFWKKTMATNLDGAFLTVREGLRAMEGRGWGRIIVVASVAGQRGLKYGGAYCASKHGAIGLTRCASEETHGTGITANAICPGYVLTDLVSEAIERIQAKTGMSAEEAEAKLASTNPSGKMVTCEEVAAAAMYLVGPNSGAITGQSIQVSGGHV